MSLAETDVIAQLPNCLTVDINDEAVVMSVESGEYISLDPVSKDIWRLIAEPRSVGDLCACLAADYDAPAATIEPDVIGFLDFMIARKVAHVVG